MANTNDDIFLDEGIEGEMLLVSNQISFDAISDYIIKDPQNWDTDKLKLP